MPGSSEVLSAMLSHLILTQALWGKYYFPSNMKMARVRKLRSHSLPQIPQLANGRARIRGWAGLFPSLCSRNQRVSILMWWLRQEVSFSKVSLPYVCVVAKRSVLPKLGYSKSCPLPAP